MTKNAILQKIESHKKLAMGGVVSVCSAHPQVIIAAAQIAQDYNEILLIESTSNQVDQFGGYTGMTPKDFVGYVNKLLLDNHLSTDKLVLGGDHLGPNAWQDKPAAEAMDKADELIRQYVSAGYQKIHLDCSMSCADDPEVLSDEVVAQRAARLCKIAEDTAKQTQNNVDIVYIIGTEVPVPGGAQEDLDTVTPTTPAAAQKTYEVHRQAFNEQGLEDAWHRVIGLVVQPGVEFDHHSVVDYESDKAAKLSALADQFPLSVFEAHSTDYQKPEAFKALVKDHFAILKVGPALTFALREAYFALDMIAQEMALDIPSLRNTLEQVMLNEPKYWQKYYLGNDSEQRIARAYSLSDRCRYYWPQESLEKAVSTLKEAINSHKIPLGLLKQYLPLTYETFRENKLKQDFDEMVRFHIQQALKPYYEAVLVKEK